MEKLTPILTAEALERSLSYYKQLFFTTISKFEIFIRSHHTWSAQRIYSVLFSFPVHALSPGDLAAGLVCLVYSTYVF